MAKIVSALNVVRFRVKPGCEEQFLEIHRKAKVDWPGFKRASLVDTGDRTYCLVGEWEKFDDIVAARPKMLAMLDRFRDTLEDLGGDLGVTDPVSGEVVLDLKPNA